MKQVHIAGIVIKNFRSFQSESFTFPDAVGLTYLAGDNEVEPRLGANGAGKTSLLEAIVWCFYGRSIRGARTSQVRSWGAEDCMVMVSLLVDGDLRVIKRTGPPDRLYVNDEVVSNVDDILGLNYERYLHSVVFGQGRPLFPDLSLPVRGQLFDDVLDLGMWLRCADVASDHHKGTATQITTAKQSLARVEGQLYQIPSDADFQKAIDEVEAERAQGIEKYERLKEEEKQRLIAEMREIIERVDGFEKAVEEARVTLELTPAPDRLKVDSLSESLRRLNTAVGQVRSQKAQNERDLLRLQKEKESLEAGNCSACGQPLRDSLLKTAYTECTRQMSIALSNIGNADELLKTQTQLEKEAKAAYDAAQDQDIDARRTRDIASRDLTHNKLALDRVMKESDRIVAILDGRTPGQYDVALRVARDAVNPHVAAKDRALKTRIELTEAKDKIDASILHLESESLVYEYWKTAFKQIRLFYIEEILGALTIEINSAISSLGLVNWRVQLVTETENKSGTTKFGVQIRIHASNGNSGEWETWSGGESQRLRLAMAMGMSSLIQRASGVWYDLEVWDESSNWLSEFGIEDLLTSLAYRAEVNQKRVWVVDHRALTYSGFNDTFVVRKGSEGSKVYRI